MPLFLICLKAILDHEPTEEQEMERQANPNLMAVRSCCIVNNDDIQNSSELVSCFGFWFFFLSGGIVAVF